MFNNFLKIRGLFYSFYVNNFDNLQILNYLLSVILKKKNINIDLKLN